MNALKILVFSGLAATALLADQTYATPTNLPPPPGPILNLDGQPLPHSSFAHYSVNFTATDTATNIMLAERDDPGFTYLDNVSVSNINDPGVNLIQNGGFENGRATSGGNILAPAGWTYQNPQGVADVGYVGCFFFTNAYAGNCSWVNQAVGGYDSISQSISTMTGETYQISFYASWSPAIPFLNHATHWSELSTNGLPGIFANGVDITVYADAASPSVNVPEPAALGMFGLGVLMIGLLARLRRRFD